MKTINNIVLAVAAVACLASCAGEKTYWQPAELAKQENYSFANKALAYTFTLADDMSKVVIPVNRTASEKAATLSVEVYNASEFLEYPESVSFEAGSSVGEYVITVKSAFEIGQAEVFGLKFDSELVAASGVDSTSVKVMLDYTWVSLGVGKFMDAFNFSDEYDVPVYQAKEAPEWFKLEDPYTAALKAEYSSDEFTTPDTDLKFKILKPGDTLFDTEVTEEDLVYYPEFNTGWLYDADHPAYMIHPSEFSSLAGEENWLYNKVLWYQENGLPAQVQFAPMFYMYGLGGYNYTQNSGVITITFPDVVIEDFSVAVAYNGRSIDLNEKEYVNATVKLGDDVAYAQVALVEGAMSNDILYAVLGGTVDCQTIEEAGDVVFEMVDPAPGKYTIVAVSYDANDEAQDYGYKTFTYTSHGATDAEPVLMPVEGYYQVDPEGTCGDPFVVALEELENGQYAFYADWFGQFGDFAEPILVLDYDSDEKILVCNDLCLYDGEIDDSGTFGSGWYYADAAHTQMLVFWGSGDDGMQPITFALNEKCELSSMSYCDFSVHNASSGAYLGVLASVDDDTPIVKIDDPSGAPAKVKSTVNMDLTRKNGFTKKHFKLLPPVEMTWID